MIRDMDLDSESRQDLPEAEEYEKEAVEEVREPVRNEEPAREPASREESPAQIRRRMQKRRAEQASAEETGVKRTYRSGSRAETAAVVRHTDAEMDEEDDYYDEAPRRRASEGSSRHSSRYEEDERRSSRTARSADGRVRRSSDGTRSASGSARRSSRYEEEDVRRTSGRSRSGERSRYQERDRYADARGRDRRYRDYDPYDDDDLYEDEYEDGKKKTSWPIWVALIFFIALFIFALYQLISIFLEYRNGEAEYNRIRNEAQELLNDAEKNTEPDVQPTDENGNPLETLPNRKRNEEWFKQLEYVYDGIVAWITIDGTSVDYPVMYSGDNTYYLTHTSVGTINSAGAIFLEEQNKDDLSDTHVIIYGHNMKNGAMFAPVIDYVNAGYDFFNEHRFITLDTREGTMKYEIFSVQETDSSSNVYTVGFWPGENFNNFLQGIKNASSYDTGVSVNGNDQVISLSTCTNVGEGRVLLHAKRVE